MELIAAVLLIVGLKVGATALTEETLQIIDNSTGTTNYSKRNREVVRQLKEDAELKAEIEAIDDEALYDEE